MYNTAIHTAALVLAKLQCEAQARKVMNINNQPKSKAVGRHTYADLACSVTGTERRLLPPHAYMFLFYFSPTLYDLAWMQISLGCSNYCRKMTSPKGKLFLLWCKKLTKLKPLDLSEGDPNPKKLPKYPLQPPVRLITSTVTIHISGLMHLSFLRPTVALPF